MGKIKGWSKQVDNRGKDIASNYIVTWKNTTKGSTYEMKSMASVEIVKPHTVDNVYQVMITNRHGLFKMNKQFRTQKEAENFAIKYMRANPRG